ncbi:MAG: hypothetical protein ACRD2I_21760 [Vicinamibacterales bacterium]
MIRTGSGRLSRRPALVGIAIYALFLIASPFEHHDLSCELKTPQHCTSCTSTQLGSDAPIALTPGAAQLADVGHATAFVLLDEGTLLVVRSAGRSPPARA